MTVKQARQKVEAATRKLSQQVDKVSTEADRLVELRDVLQAAQADLAVAEAGGNGVAPKARAKVPAAVTPEEEDAGEVE